MKLLVGLGNPGGQYQRTRHNIGRRVVETIAGSAGRKFQKKSRLAASVLETQWENEEAVLAYPEVFMNQSGQSLKALVRFFRLSPEKDLLLILDDFALFFGLLRLRYRGSDGGHNGLKSIIQELGTQEFARLRIGIGPRSLETQSPVLDVPAEDYVLAEFTETEDPQLQAVLEKGEAACRNWIRLPPEEAMNSVNIKQSRG